MNHDLLPFVERHAPKGGPTQTSIPGLQLYRISGPIQRSPAVYTPRICINTLGCKRVFSSAGMHTYDAHRFICCTMPVPVEVEVPDATPDEPVIDQIQFDAAQPSHTATCALLRE